MGAACQNVFQTADAWLVLAGCWLPPAAGFRGLGGDGWQVAALGNLAVARPRFKVWRDKTQEWHMGFQRPDLSAFSNTFGK